MLRVSVNLLEASRPNMCWLLPSTHIIARQYPHLIVPNRTVKWSPAPFTPTIILYPYEYLHNKIEEQLSCTVCHKINGATKSAALCFARTVGALTSFISQDNFIISLARASHACYSFTKPACPLLSQETSIISKLQYHSFWRNKRNAMKIRRCCLLL